MPTIQSSGTDIYYEEEGAGIPIILGHSFLCSGEMWAPQVAALSGQYRVINMDWPGHGRSGPATTRFSLDDLTRHVIAVLDHAGVGSAIWAGLSVGGMVALRGALNYSERVSALVLLDTHVGVEPTSNVFKYRLMGLGVRLRGVDPYLPALLPLMFGTTTQKTNAALIEEWRPRLAAVHVPSMLLTLSALIARKSLVPRLPEIAVPTLVMVGEEDQTLPPAYSQEIAAGISGAKLVTVPAAGHLVTLERPNFVNQQILAFLDGVSAV